MANKETGCIWVQVEILIITIAVFLKSWVLKTLWLWFAVPLFGLPQLTIAYALGLSLMITVVVPTPPRERQGKDYLEKISYAIGESIFGPLLILAIGFAAKQFV